MPQLTRRAMLRYGAGATVGAGAYALGALLGSGPSVADPAAVAGPAPTYLTGSFRSVARGGIETNWAIARPPGQTQTLRPVIALHGRGGTAAGVMGLGVEDALVKIAAAGRPAFAVVSVDGGDNSYWHKRASGEDPGSMVVDELLPLLATKGLDTSRVAFIGWSMGGYGALLLGARLGPARTAGICAVSPALWTSYQSIEAGAFDSAEDWATNTVFGLPALSAIPIRVDCGASDRFYPATKQFVTQLRRPVEGGFPLGDHDETFWRSQLLDELIWLAS